MGGVLFDGGIEKEILNEDFLSLIMGGSLKHGWEEYLDGMMAKYEDKLTKEEFQRMMD